MVAVPVVSLNTLHASVDVLQNNLCYNSNDAQIQINTNGGVPPYTYSLNNQLTNTINGYVSQLAAGNYDLQIHDANGCPFESSFTISQANPINVDIVKTVDADCYLNTYGQAQLAVQGGNPPYSVDWQNGETGMEANQLIPGNHQVIIKDEYGCEVSKSFNIAFNAVSIKPDINNVFTPNGDGQNDTWTIKNIDTFRENELFIYNRWGNEVYTTKNYTNDWNGSDLAEGTYFYTLKVKICEDWFEFNGYVTILR